MQKISRYYHTIKPLKLEQILYRLKYRFFPVKKLSVKPSEKLSAKPWPLKTPMVGQQSVFENGEVCFLNKRARIDTPEDWNNSAQHSKLWLYNLHYFDDLNSAGANQRVSLQKQVMRKWITENPPLHGNGWEPYPLSLRLVNWVKWCQRNQDYGVETIRSIEQQADALMMQLEFHILGNHLFANAKALVFVGCFLESDRAANYLSMGLELLEREVSEQFLADGGHFELSPMYHCILLWDLIDLYNLGLASGNTQLSHYLDEWKDVIQRGLSWLSIMSHPDGDISFFNDAAFGVAPSPSDVFNFAASVGIEVNTTTAAGLMMLCDSGYSRLHKSDFTLFFDHAEVGPDYLPGHAHADTLSVELSLGNQRVFVNSGTSEYGTGQGRQYQRSSAAHNTLFVDGENSSDVWAGFRVGERARVHGVESRETNEAITVRAEHDGFCRLRKGLTHSRECTVSADRVVIEDELGTRCFKPVIAHFHLHPDVGVETVDTHSVRLSLASGESLLFSADEPVSVEKTTWHPEFGKSIPTQRLAVALSGCYLSCKLILGS